MRRDRMNAAPLTRGGSPDGPARADHDVSGPRITAFRLDSDGELRIEPAWVGRDWIRGTVDGFAARCLPLLMANQSGWFLLNGQTVHVTWSGRDDRTAITIEREGGDDMGPPVSHFGHGILTWEIPALFRTDPGWNLLARGPANWPKDGAYALEGLIETDWAVATFTMNWILTRPGATVTFEKDEPICMLVPQRRGELERFVADERPVADDPELRRGYEEWIASRVRTVVDGTRGSGRGWEGDYQRGTSPSGASAARGEHQRKRRLRRFRGTA